MDNEVYNKMLKVAFAISRDGHKLDAEEYRAQADYYDKSVDARKKYREESPIKDMFLHEPAELRELQRRHAHYAARKHEKGKNAYNPFGGWMTPVKSDKKKS